MSTCGYRTFPTLRLLKERQLPFGCHDEKKNSLVFETQYEQYIIWKKQIVTYKIAGFSVIVIINSLSVKSNFNLKVFCTENEAFDSIQK